MEAAQWVAARMSEDSFDQAGFEAWLAGDPRRKALFDTMWRRIMNPSIGLAVQAYGERRKRRNAVLVAGCAAALLLSGGYLAWPTAELFFAPSRDYAAAGETVRQIRLDDGSFLTLAGGAVVRVRYTRHEREVTLTRGTIFADVARDADRPFRVEAGDGRVTVLGTRFEVVMKPSMVRVTVEKGAVRFGPDGWFRAPIELAAKQVASLTANGMKRESDQAGEGGAARWRSEWVEYRNAPLKQVVADLESVSPLPIEIAGAGLSERRVNGRIRLTDPLRQIENLSIIHEFKIRRDRNVLILEEN